MFATEIALPTDRPGGAAVIADLLENLCRFMQSPASTAVISHGVYHIGEVVQTTRERLPIGKHTPTGQATLKQAVSRGIVAPVSRGKRQPIQRCGYAPTIPLAPHTMPGCAAEKLLPLENRRVS